MAEFLFVLFAVVALVAGFSVIWQRNPVASAISLVVTLACQAGLFVQLDAHFAATMQILVYAGAIMVLFIFVIMLLNLQPNELGVAKYSPWKFVGGALAALAGMMVIVSVSSASAAEPVAITGTFGTISQVGELLFSKYLIPFEILSIVLTVAVIGAIVLGKKEL